MSGRRHDAGSRWGAPPRRRLLALALSAAACLAWLPAAAIAAPATPSPAPRPRPACDIAPRSPQELAALLATPEMATPPATTEGQTLPAGVPAAPETAAAIDETVRAWLACHNAGEPLRAWGLFSDGYLYRLLARQGAPGGLASAAATPTPGAQDGAVLLDIRGQRLLPDGRFGATVVLAYPSVPTPKTFFFYFTRDDGRLLIDGILGEISFSIP